ncbi:hypothetical protein Acr_03g0015470 [Actinidia rufa]|uniref:Mediator of RNA polymerase II transcription subunit n=1 Tax=Actinidia rufa TaxID=165716 RepID=A0A7J0EE88_9ERIC|nr:hypothetical protein Acr_03g0015470 [Actinidia rufa]
MEACQATSLACPTLSGSWRFATEPSCRKKVVNVRARREMAEGGDGEKMVDENMIVLRMRIRKAEMSEGRHVPLSDWMEWEKKYYALYYNEDVCEGVGLLQSFLMDTRPCLALGMVVILALSVPISSFVVMAHAIEVAKWFLSWFILSK